MPGSPAWKSIQGVCTGLVLALVLTACGSTTPGRVAKFADPSGAAPSEPAVTGLPQRDRPNILVIETDDMRADDLAWMPSVRRLIGGSGLTFENSFTPYPLCCPSRASFLTGQHAHNHQVLSHVEPWGFRSFDDRTTLATRLQDAGYRTALVGKYLNGYGAQPTRRGEPSLRYVPPGWDEWWAGTDHRWEKGDAFRGGTYSYFHLTQNVNGTIRQFPGRYSTDVMAEQTRDLVDAFAAQEQPFFLWWNPVAPHKGAPREPDDPRYATPARPDWVKGRFDDEITHAAGTPADGSAEADSSDKPRWLRGAGQLSVGERADLTSVARQRAESLYVLDQQVARTITRLKEAGVYEETVIVFTSDNGFYLGEHLKRTGKVKLHEPSLRVPLLISGPGVPHGRRYDPVTNIDLAPTFASYAGTTMPDADGIDLRPLIEDGDRGWTRPVLLESLIAEYPRTAPARGFATRLNVGGVRLGRWKLTAYSSGELELYDLLRDPLELDNLAAGPTHGRQLARLRAVWEKVRACRGTSCAAPIADAGLRLGPVENRRVTDRQTRETRAHFDR